MNSAWEFLDQLSVGHVEWIFNHCVERRIGTGETIISTGKKLDSIFIILSGLFEVYPTEEKKKKIAIAGPGEFLGELSFLDDEPASATVVAVEPSVVQALPLDVFREQVEVDPVLAARVYHAFGVMVAARLRRLTQRTIGDDVFNKGLDTQESQIWGTLSEPLEILKGTFRSLDKTFLRSREDDLETAYEKLSSDLSSLMLAINDTIGQQSGVTPGAKERIGARLQSELLPYLLLSKNAERWYSKPRGYAGDFMTIELMYENQPSGTGRLGPLIDRCFLDLPPPRAARNRRPILAKEIMATVQRAQAKNRPARIASLACGPARELYDVFEQLSDPGQLQCTLVDMDQQALDFVQKLRDERGLTANIRLVKENLIFMAARRSKLEIEDQDLIYSVGLIDYFTDQFVISLIDYIYDLLEPGGRVILGNFHPRNPGKAMMDCVMDWPLIHRREDRMNELFSRSKFNTVCSRIFYEDQQINLFAECIR